MNKPVTIEAYIAGFPIDVQHKLEQLLMLVRELAPDAIEGISYGMPAFKLNKKPLVYFAAFAHHIGLYALPSGHAHFATELKGYKQGKGSVQFPLNDDLPLNLIRRIVEFRVNENLNSIS